MPYLFSYGTLKQETVQRETFGRKLTGTQETLTQYHLNMVEITDAKVLKLSGKKFHPIIEYSGNENDVVTGTLFEVTTAEILRADEYEVDDYKRIEVTFTSGNNGFIYVKK